MEAKFYTKLNNKTVQCNLCHHFCKIQDGNVGICGVRKNENGILESLVYGYPVAINIDPIEKKPLFHFLPGSYTYSLGTFGCNFRCANCLNWDISQKKLKSLPAEEAGQKYFTPKEIVETALENNCQSISYTYNEPTIFAEYALDIMKLAKKNKLKNIWVSNGFMSDECLEAIIPYLDAVNIDLKSIDDKFYQKYCGAKVKPVLKNLKKLKAEQIHTEITSLIIPTLSDDTKMLKGLAEFIVKELGAETPWHISKFSPEISWKLKDLSPTPNEAIYRAYEIGKNVGLKYIYAGNMPGDEKENTYCPACGELAIRRFDYNIERFDNHGHCAKCDKNL
ncbi:MAG: AmmeMemoRadiSam system radical SAM enzyme [Patescibacteria group bacterium]|nr:AmmeMemoRadiSam system radical SAM enzyme [Patescibacteria group bacterium]MDD4610346.1 AmmeMemoRadiSam system radical SAM enzyme [Patescibacteria group bacterium]